MQVAQQQEEKIFNHCKFFSNYFSNCYPRHKNSDENQLTPSKPVPNNLNYSEKLLLENNLILKKIPLNSKSLFSSISECLFFTPQYSQDLQTLILGYFKQLFINDSLPEQLLDLKDNYLLLQDFVSQQYLKKFESKTLILLQKMLGIGINVYYLSSQNNLELEVYNKINSKKIISIYRNEQGDFYPLFSVKHMNKAKECQEIVYDLIENAITKKENNKQEQEKNKEQKDGEKKNDDNDNDNEEEENGEYKFKLINLELLNFELLNDEQKIDSKKEKFLFQIGKQFESSNELNPYNLFQNSNDLLLNTSAEHRKLAFNQSQSQQLLYLEKYLKGEEGNNNNNNEQPSLEKKQSSSQSKQNNLPQKFYLDIIKQTQANQLLQNNSNSGKQLQADGQNAGSSDQKPVLSLNVKAESFKESSMSPQMMQSTNPQLAKFISQQQQIRQKSQSMNTSKGPKIIPTENENVRYTGKLKFFNEEKQFGFFIFDKDQTDIFVHQDDLEKAGISVDYLKKIKNDNIQLKVSFKTMTYMGKKGASKKAVEIIKQI